MILKPKQFFADRYILIEKLGAGGYSEVWLAEDSKSENMLVALKVFASNNGLDKKGLAVFSKEYSLVFNLRHPYLLRPNYYDDWNYMPYLVMQYMPNGSSARLCGSITEFEVATFLIQIGSAVKYLHEQSPPIIHLDIKPDNVLIDSQENFILTDFGISNRIRKTLERSLGVQSQNKDGTTAYMAPERFSENIDERIPRPANDVFSLGVTVFELLTEELAYGKLGGCLAEKIKPAKLPSQFSPVLCQLLSACMAKEINKRPYLDEIILSAKSFAKNGYWELPKRLKDPGETIGLDQGPNFPTGSNSKTVVVSYGDIQNRELFRDPTQKISSYSNPAIKKSSGPSGINSGKKPRIRRLKTSGFIWISVIIVFITLFLFARELWISADGFFDYKETIHDIHFDMVAINGGVFYIGSPEDEEYRSANETLTLASVDPFYMGKTEVTFELYDEFCMDTGRPMPDDNGWGRGTRPVINVSWHDAVAFCLWLSSKTGNSYRLPNELEWEFACRAGTITPFYTGDCLNTNEANYDGNHPYGTCSFGEFRMKTLPVGSLPPNPWGLRDMHGNVWEWCDVWVDDLSVTSNDAVMAEFRVLRGGGWNSIAQYCRSANRSFVSPETSRTTIGFRVARPK